MKKTSFPFLLLLMIFTSTAGQQTWQSKYIKEEKGTLISVPDQKGNIIPDFSKVGYNKGYTELPDIGTVKTITAPAEGDAGKIIQSAIDELSLKPADQSGFRGAILLKKGIYKIGGSIRIPESGIVLKGEGDNMAGTVLVASGKGKRNLIVISGKGSSKEITGTRTKITDSFVPVGSFSFTVENSDAFSKGDLITILRPGTEKWIHDLKMDKIEERDGTKQWIPKDYDLKFEREIIKTEGRKIWIDQPVVMEMEDKYGGGFIYRSSDDRISRNGIENILFRSEYASENDEDHGWFAIEIQNCENGWVKNVTSEFFGNGCVSVGKGSKYITVTDSKCFDAKSQITGGRRYSFASDGQMCLVKNCETTEGRHDFVTGSRVCGPNVFFNCTARNTHADIGPHHRWSVGTLYDNITTDGEINIQDRGNWGSGHGWAGANQVLWNCTAGKVCVQNPWVSARNWSIGLTGNKSSGRLPGRPDGEWEGLNRKGLSPASLYLAQKKLSVIFLNDEIISLAEKLLIEKPVTITSFVCRRSAGGIHDFYSEGDYWWPDPKNPDGPYIQRDGMTNPENFTEHRKAMIRLSQIVGNLASAYRITGNEKYVSKAFEHLKAWFADQETMMNPSLLYSQAIKGRFTGRGIGIIDTIQLMEVAQAIIVMENAKCVDREQLAAIKGWFTDYLKWLMTHQYSKDEMNAKNNHGTCWVMQVASFARLTGDEEIMDFCRKRYKEILLPNQMATDGSFPEELKRTKPYGYSLFNLDAMTMVCLILSDENNDLLNYQTPDGKCLKKGIEFLYPFVADKSKWTYPKDVMYWDNWPVAQPFLIFGALESGNKNWFETWKSLDHFPVVEEVIRNLPVRNPIIWMK